MEKKIRMIPAVFLSMMLAVLSGCSGDVSINVNPKEAAAEENSEQGPEIGRIQSICKLATLKCQYHNIAKSIKYPGNGIVDHLMRKSRKFWIEYQGTVEISFDVNKLKMQQDGKKITIVLPEPELTCDIVQGSWNQDSYIIEPNTWILQNPITADDQKNAVAAAQADMEKQVRDSTLIATAEDQAKALITSYINQIGDLTGNTYQVTIETTESSGPVPTETTETGQS